MKVFGIKNLGNTCYMNSILQSLLSLKTLRSFLDTKKYKTRISENIKTIIDLPYISESLLESIHPRTLYNSLCTEYKTDFFKSKRQQDAHECLLILIDILEEGISEKLSPFYGKYSTILKCDSCCNERCIEEDFVSLCLPGMFKDEVIMDYECEKCKKSGSTSKSYKINVMPDILCLYVNRFNITRCKNNDPFVFKESIYDSYTLQSIVLHSGYSIDGGHYTSVSKRNGVWYEFNDTVVTPTELDNTRKNDIYMLFYTTGK